MKGLVLRWLMSTGAILLASYAVSGIHVSGFGSAAAAAVMLGVLNAFFRPLALVLTLPLNIVTFGLFTFVINAAMLKMAASVIPGFVVAGFWPAVGGSMLISIVSWALNTVVTDQATIGVIDLHHRGGNRWS